MNLISTLKNGVASVTNAFRPAEPVGAGGVKESQIPISTGGGGGSHSAYIEMAALTAEGGPLHVKFVPPPGPLPGFEDVGGQFIDLKGVIRECNKHPRAKAYLKKLADAAVEPQRIYGQLQRIVMAKTPDAARNSWWQDRDAAARSFKAGNMDHVPIGSLEDREAEYSHCQHAAVEGCRRISIDFYPHQFQYAKILSEVAGELAAAQEKKERADHEAFGVTYAKKSRLVCALLQLTHRAFESLSGYEYGSGIPPARCLEFAGIEKLS